MEQMDNKKIIASLQKNLTVVKVFLLITPVLGYFYTLMLATAQSMTLRQLLETNPSITIVFLMTMVNAYIGYLVHLMSKELNENHYSFACINLPLLIIAQSITLNILYLSMLLWIFYKYRKGYHLSIKHVLKEVKMNQMIKQGGGSLIVLTLSIMCLFISFRLT